MTATYKLWRDPTTYTLIAANAYTLFLVLTGHLSLAQVLWLFWWQGVIIGFTTVIRMLNTRRFIPRSIASDNNAILKTPFVKVFLVIIFIFHYGGFQTTYAFFLVFVTAMLEGQHQPFSGGALIVPLILFAFHHGYSVARTIRQGGGDASVAELMFTPYKRIIPMHITLMAAFWFLMHGYSAALAGLFVGLKAIVDVASHFIDHRRPVQSTTQPEITPETV